MTGLESTGNIAFRGIPTIDPAMGTLDYEIQPNTSGTQSVRAVLRDDGGTASGSDDTSESRTFTITANPVNDAPSFELPASPDQAVREDADPQTVHGFASGISAGPSDEAGQELTFDLATDNDALFAPGGKPALNAVTGDLTYALAPDANGAANVTAVLRDGGGTENGGSDRSGQRSFRISVEPVNDAPVATDDASQTFTKEPVRIPVLANDRDVDGDGLTVTEVSGPQHGVATTGGDGAIAYEPDNGFKGIDTFTYTVSDGNGATDTATVTVEVVKPKVKDKNKG